MTIAALRTNAAVLGVFVTLTATYLLVLAELGTATSGGKTSLQTPENPAAVTVLGRGK